jgi:23S rRNA pseudouridine955/2504/2580 synthase
MQAHLITGRTHQIRVHTSAKGHPILGDDRYGQFAINRIWSKFGLSRMFLHAMRLELNHPKTGERIVIEAPLPDMLACIVKKLIPYAI